jgi:NADH:ubiquinone oxidoreductase subunit E
MKKHNFNIEICMGSSCFSRGNRFSLPVIQSFVKEYNLESNIKVVGSLCSENCSKGPILIINGKIYKQVHSDSVKDLLLHIISEGNDE